MAVNAKDIRNVALIGHSGEGKTTLAEALLFNAGVLDRLGKVDDGNSTMDFDPEEVARRISISLSVANCTYKGTKINIIDVPGYFDFECEMLEALTVADSAIIVTSATGSMSVGTEKALEYCLEHKIPSLIFVNGIDKENSNYQATVDAIKARFNKVSSIIVPELNGHKTVGYVNAVTGQYCSFAGAAGAIPASLQGEYDSARSSIVEIAAESDDELMMKFFEGEELTAEEVTRGFSTCLLNGVTIPVLTGSALARQGINELLDLIVAFLPSPATRPALDAHGKVIAADANAPVVLRVFKTIVDRFVGKLSIFKVISGTLKSGMTLRNLNSETNEKISNVYFIRGDKQETTDCATAGDIAALAKLSATSTGDVLCEGAEVELAPVEWPRPVYFRAVTAAKKGDEDKVFGGLSKLKDEDIAFTVNKDPETGDMLLSGLGETQLDVLCKKLKSKFNCEAVLSDPRIPYRETIRKSAEAEGKHKKQSGGAGQYGHCWVRFEPGAADGVFEFVDAVVGGAVPRQFIPSVEKGLRQAIQKGVLAGYPVVDLKATLYDGSTHPVDGKDIAFQMAAILAFKAGCVKAGPVLLEPIYELKIVVPDNYLGDVMGDMNKRRGRIMGTEMANGKQIVTAEAPYAEILKYATDLRSMTQGRGRFEISFARYEEVPATSVTKIVEEAKKLQEEE
ncbi:MAG: elongation factor G [Clostridiales bacterium]|nr:elongation factor G [Clostridiales bacterium]